MLWIVVSIFCPIPSGLTPFHPLWEMGRQDKPRSSRAEQSSTLPSPKHPQAIFTRQPRITLHLRPATHLSAHLYRVLTEHLLSAQYCVWCYPRCIPAQTTRVIPEQKHDGRYLSDLSEGLSCTQFDWHVFWSGDQSDFRWVLLVRHLW